MGRPAHLRCDWCGGTDASATAVQLHSVGQFTLAQLRCDGCGGTAWSVDAPTPGDQHQPEEPETPEEPEEPETPEEAEDCPLFRGLSLGNFDDMHATPDAPLTSANVREAVIAG